MFFDNILPIIIFTVIAGSIAFGLSLASIKFEVKQDLLYEEVKSIIGDINCGVCGYPGCAGYAKALTSFEDKLGKCKPMKQAAYDKIDKILKDAASQMTDDK